MVIMVKAKNIWSIYSKYDTLVKMLEREPELLKIDKYKTLKEELEEQRRAVELQLSLIKSKTGLNMFIDRFIRKVKIDMLEDKYLMSKSTLYRYLKAAKEEFEQAKGLLVYVSAV